MRTIFVWTIFVLFLSACNPAKQIQRICKRNPEVCKQDSTNKKIKDSIPGIDAEFTFDVDGPGDTESIRLNPNSSGLYFINNLPITSRTGTLYATDPPTYVNDPIPSHVCPKPAYRPIIKDTVTKVINGLTIKLFQSGKSIGVKIHKPAEVIEKEVKVASGITIQAPEYKHKATTWDWVCYVCTVVFGLLLIILVPIVWDLRK